MKQNIVFLLLFFIPVSGYSQNRTIDSLKNLVSTQKEDTNKVNILNELSWQLLLNNYPDKAEKYIDEATSLAVKLKFRKGEGVATNNLGIVYQTKYNYAAALKYYYKSLKINEEIGYLRGIAFSNQSIGAIYSVQESFTEAIDKFSRALKIYEAIDDKEGIGYIYNNFGGIFIEMRDFDEAMKNYRAALKVKTQTGNKAGMSMANTNIGEILLIQNKHDEAINSFAKALQLGIQSGRKELVANAYIGMGMVKFSLKNYNEATNKFKMAQSLLKESGYAESYIKLYRVYTSLDSATGNWKDAFIHHKLYNDYRYSFSNEENSKKVTQLILQNEFNSREALAKAEQDKKNLVRVAAFQKERILRNAFIVTAILLVLLLMGLFNRYNYKQKANKELSVAYKELKNTQDQLVQNEKLAAFGTMASRVSHEILNPLNFVNNFSDLSQELVDEFLHPISASNQKETGDLLLKNLQLINQHGKRAESIIRQLQEHLRAGTTQEFFEK